jgi:GTP-binding protein
VRTLWPEIARGLHSRGVEGPLAISAVTGEGVEAVLRRAAAALSELPAPGPIEEEHKPGFLEKPGLSVGLSAVEDKSFIVERERDGAWRVRGTYIEKIVKMTRWEYYDAVMRFQRILEALGITETLRIRGVQEGDTVRIGAMELEWSDMTNA